MARVKKYSDTAAKYAEKLSRIGYTVKYNWVDPYGGYYEDVTVRGPIFCGYGREFDTVRQAYEYIQRVY